MRQALPLLLLPLAAIVVGCGIVTTSTTSSSSGTGGATSSSHTSSGAGAGGASSCQPAFVEAGASLAGDMEIPIYHRAEPACCPTERAPAPAGQPYGPAQAVGCTTDSQCTSGRDGRCYPFEGLVGPGGCSYDACLTDSDCPSGASCLCRSSASDTSTNRCVTGGDCVLDSDCGQGGYCSPSAGCEGPLAYHCHTATDTCINDTDCPSVDAGGFSCDTASICAFDVQAKHWGCTQMVCCPP
jgi:hypothetical protein